MGKLTQSEVARVKGLGFLRNRGTDCFSGRIVPAGTVFSADDLSAVAELARCYGNGKVIFTARQCAELPGIPFEKIDEAIRAAAEKNLYFGGTGAKIRPVVACKGTTCVYGNCDTQALALRIYQDYYLGWADVKLPHKFKIGIGGCPNSCMKPSLNDFGIEGHRAPRFDPEFCRGCKVCQIEAKCPSKAAKLQDGKLSIDPERCKTCGVCVGKCPFHAVADQSPVRYRIFVGGTWGKNTRMGTALSRLVTEEEIFPLLEKTMLWFKQNAYEKERLGSCVDRVGVEALEQALFSDELLERKEEILAAEVLKRP